MCSSLLLTAVQDSSLFLSMSGKSISVMIPIIKVTAAEMAVKHHLFLPTRRESFHRCPVCLYAPPGFICNQNIWIKVIPCPFTKQVPRKPEYQCKVCTKELSKGLSAKEWEFHTKKKKKRPPKCT